MADILHKGGCGDAMMGADGGLGTPQVKPKTYMSQAMRTWWSGRTSTGGPPSIAAVQALSYASSLVISRSVRLGAGPDQ